uniref:Sugar phosphate phosphatase n=1 Tax=Bionectria ochroleuca TaxID=29856 RepID=A0A8H7KFW5_BIOOC
MEYDTKTPQSITSDPKSFASDSVRMRWPTILTQAIQDITKSTSKAEGAEKQAEGKKIIEQLTTLKDEVVNDAKLTPIVNDEFPDEIAAYNKEIQDRGNPSWLDVTWLFAECYMYRRISTFFNLTKHWKEYDLFAIQKLDTFRTSRNAVLELASRYKELVSDLKADKEKTHNLEAEKILFQEFFEICLWGNATDLSLLTNMTYEDIQKLQGSEARKAAEQNILVNDLPGPMRFSRRPVTRARRSEESILSSTTRASSFTLTLSSAASSSPPAWPPRSSSDPSPSLGSSQTFCPVTGLPHSTLFRTPSVSLRLRTTMRRHRARSQSPSPPRRSRISSLSTKTGLRNTRMARSPWCLTGTGPVVAAFGVSLRRLLSYTKSLSLLSLSSSRVTLTTES